MEERLAELEARLEQTESELRATRERLLTLEQGHRRLAARGRRVTGAAVLAILAAIGLGLARPGGSAAVAAPFSRVQAPFTVVGGGNRPLFQVLESASGGGYLRLLDGGGNVIVEAGQFRAEGFRGLRATDEQSRPTGALGQHVIGTAVFRGASAHDPQGRNVANIAHGSGIGPQRMEATGLTVQTAAGLPLIDVGLRSDNGQVGIDIADPGGSGRESVRIGFRPANGADLGLSGIEVDGTSGAPLALLRSRPATGEFLLFDLSGNVVFSAPPTP